MTCDGAAPGLYGRASGSPEFPVVPRTIWHELQEGLVGRKGEDGGLAGLSDRTYRPRSHPWQMPAGVLAADLVRL